jgi:hypothetical protein
MSYQGNPDMTTLYELPEGELLEGEVVRLPRRGAHHGTRLFIRTEQGVRAVAATSRRGHTILARELERQSIQEGDMVKVVWYWGETAEGYPFRRYELTAPE